MSITDEGDAKPGYFAVATYKGNQVAVKKIDKRTVELNRAVLLELKQVDVIRKIFCAKSIRLQSIPWILEEFRHNRMVQSPHESYCVGNTQKVRFRKEVDYSNAIINQVWV